MYYVLSGDVSKFGVDQFKEVALNAHEAMLSYCDNKFSDYESIRVTPKGHGSYISRNSNSNSIAFPYYYVYDNLTNLKLAVFPLSVKTASGATSWYCSINFRVSVSGRVYEHSVSHDTGGGLEPPPFTPPTPTSPKKIQDLPFYQDLLESGEIGSLDDLTQAEYDYLQSEIQRQEVGWFDSLIETAKDFFLRSDSNAFKDVNISYDSSNHDIVSYYADNGLDMSKSYNINMDGIRVGYNTGNGFVPITNGHGVSNGGAYVVSKETKDKFLSNGDIFMLHTVSRTVPNLGTAVSGGVAISAAVVANHYLNKVLDPLQKAQSDLIVKGITYVVSKGNSLYKSFTSGNNRVTDLINPDVQKGAFTKGIQGIISGGSAVGNSLKLNLDGQSLELKIPSTTNIDLNVPTTVKVGLDVPLDSSLKLESPTFELGITKPSFNLDLELAGVELPLGVPLSGIGLDVSGKTIGITEGGKVQLDIPVDVALPVEGLDANFKAVFANKAVNIGKSDTVLVNKIESHNIEYVSDGGIRAKEGIVAEWKDKEYKTTVTEGMDSVDKIGRDIKAWQGLHSLNDVGTFDDSIGNNIPVKKGYYPSILGAGTLELTREHLIDKANDNILSRAKAKTKTDDNDDENNMIDNLFSVLGVKLDVQTPTLAQLKSSPHLGAILEGLKTLGIFNNSK